MRWYSLSSSFGRVQQMPNSSSSNSIMPTLIKYQISGNCVQKSLSIYLVTSHHLFGFSGTRLRPSTSNPRYHLKSDISVNCWRLVKAWIKYIIRHKFATGRRSLCMFLKVLTDLTSCEDAKLTWIGWNTSVRFELARKNDDSDYIPFFLLHKVCSMERLVIKSLT